MIAQSSRLFLGFHEYLADKQMIAHNLEYPARLRTLAYVPGDNSRCYLVLREGKEIGAYVIVDFINTCRDLLLLVSYGLCDGSEAYTYDSRNILGI